MSKLRTVSWIVLALVGVATLVLALSSAYLAYRGMYPVGGVEIDAIAGDNQELLLGLRGVRGTAAAWAAAWAVLVLAVVLGPYRRGDVGSWWGILISTLVMAAVVALRVPLLGLQAGTGTALVLLVVVLVALLLDVKRLSSSRITHEAVRAAD